MKELLAMLVGALTLLQGTIYSVSFANTRSQSLVKDVLDVAWNPDGDVLAVQSAYTISFFTSDLELVAQGDNLTTLAHLDIPDTSHNSTGIAWSSDGNAFALPYLKTQSTTGISFRIWDFDDLEPKYPYDHESEVAAIVDMDWKTNSNLLAQATGYGRISDEKGSWFVSVFDLSGNNFFNSVFSFGHSPVRICKLSWHPTDSHIAVAREDGTVEIWDTTIKVPDSPLYQYKHNAALLDLKWAHNGAYLMSIDTKGTVILWDVEKKSTSTSAELALEVTAADWNSDGTLLASAGEDAIIRIWDVETGQVVATFEGHEDAIIDLDWSPDDQRIATASRDGTVRIWEVDLGD